jgi:hypothetical protein
VQAVTTVSTSQSRFFKSMALLKTAKAISVIVPPAPLASADEVIE